MEKNYLDESTILYYLFEAISSTECHIGYTPTTTEQITDILYQEKHTYEFNEFQNRSRIPYQFISYCPVVFDGLRSFFGITKTNYHAQLIQDDWTPFVEFHSPGKSGSTFYKKKSFLIKTISNEELQKLIKILKNYLDYIHNRQQTLLPQYYGAYSIKFTLSNSLGGYKQYNFVVTNYLFHQCNVLEKYDLKGSTWGRELSGYAMDSSEEQVVFKDIDFINHRGYIFSNGIRLQLLHQIRLDARFLRDNNIIDYSLALGIGRTSDMPNVNELKNFTFNNGSGEQYYLGIIDCLSDYSYNKRLLFSFQSILVKRNSSLSLSSPKEYFDRFVKFTEKIIQ